ncbi:hypothetical protein [Rhizobium sp. NRK18]|nr:hypothetical protein [Rhizobium sp. NRK18]
MERQEIGNTVDSSLFGQVIAIKRLRQQAAADAGQIKKYNEEN